MKKCDHCMLPVAERDTVYDDSPSGKKVFCCHACRAIYRMIQQEGLGDFYNKREWSSFGIPDPLRRAGDPDGAAELQPLEGTEPAVDAPMIQETDLIIDGIRCASCVWLLEKIVERSPGVTGVRVNFATHRARVRWDSAKTTKESILSRIRSVGYLPQTYTPAAMEASLHRQNRDLLIRFGTSAFFAMQLMTVSSALYAGYFQGIDPGMKRLLEQLSLLLSTPVVAYAGWPFLAGAWRGARHGVMNMDMLIILGALSAYCLSIYHMVRGGEVYFDTAVMIITLVLLGRYLENSAKQRASQAVTRLLALQPQEARLVRNGERMMVETKAVARGDLLEVRPGEKVPMDGIVRSGVSEVDESLISGESVPCVKAAGAAVIGGSLNGLGTIVIEVSRTGSDTVVAQIAQLVERAQITSAPIQRLADRVSSYFIPFVLCVAAASFWYWHQHVPFERAVMISVSVLVISCPCALGLATPVAVLAGTGRAASRGILIKGGDILERLHQVDTVVLDKTGTITVGSLSVDETHAIPAAGREGDDELLLQYAASAEQGSEHLLGAAIVRAAEARGIELLPCTSFRAIPGEGAWAEIAGSTVLVGKGPFLVQEGVNVEPRLTSTADRLERSGRTVVFVSKDGVFLGIIGLQDTPRSDAAEAIRELDGFSIKVLMITGDNERTARSIADSTGITTIRAGVLPQGKAEEIVRLRDAGSVVAMVGDGINDAPSLATADVGIAMASGSDIAVEAADVVIMRSDLRSISEAVAISRRTFRVIRQNLFWAFFYNICAIPLAVAGVLSPIVAAAAMSISSITVVLNSLRLRGALRT